MNGTEPTPHSYPFIVGIYEVEEGYYDWQFCGGAIYDLTHVITAAHCVQDYDNEKRNLWIKQYFGDYSKNVDETSQVEILAKRFTIHPGYDKEMTFTDIAIIELESPLTWTDDVQPICLPSRDVKEGDVFTVIGWGDTEGTAPGREHILREVKVPLIPRNKCTSWYPDGWVQDTQICAGYEEGLKDSCQGDSGGPLFQKRNDFFELVGVVSWGDGCADAKKPGVYQNIFDYLDWIKQVAGEPQY